MNTVRIDNVKPGDVLLTAGDTFVGWAIRLFDGSEVNHAALVVGEGEIAEATGKGLKYGTVAGSVRANRLVLDRRILASSDLGPVVTRGRWYADQGLPYAYQQILLLAVLCVTRRLPLRNRLLRGALRRTLDHAAVLLNAYDREGRTVMICSEYVFRAFDEALPDSHDVYTLDIPGVSAAPEVAGALAARPLLRAQQGSLLLRCAEPWEGGPAMAPSAGSEKILTDAVAELETLYGALAGQVALGMAAEGESYGLVEETTESELVDAARAFVTAMEPHATRAHLQATGEPAPAAGVTAWADSASAVADFVTPGDLLRTPDLWTVGQVVV